MSNDDDRALRDVVRQCVAQQGRIALITQSINATIRDYALSDKAALFPNTEEGIRKMLTPTQNTSLTEASYKTLRNKFLFANAVIAFVDKYPDTASTLSQGSLEDCYRVVKGKQPKSGQFGALVASVRSLLPGLSLAPATDATAKATTAKATTAKATTTKATTAKATTATAKTKAKTGGPVSLTNDNLNSAVAVLNSAAGREQSEAPRQMLLGAAKVLLAMRDAG